VGREGRNEMGEMKARKRLERRCGRSNYSKSTFVASRPTVAVVMMHTTS
jgi:hypothetical protein